MRKKVYIILMIFFAINLILSSYLEFKDSNENAGICNISPGTTNCSTVQQSQYAYTLGLKNTTLGIAFSILFMVLTTIYYKNPHKHLKVLKNFLLFFAAFFAVRFIYIQFFILKQICPYCLIVDTLTVANFLIFYFETKN